MIGRVISRYGESRTVSGTRMSRRSHSRLQPAGVRLVHVDGQRRRACPAGSPGRRPARAGSACASCRPARSRGPGRGSTGVLVGRRSSSPGHRVVVPADAQHHHEDDGHRGDRDPGAAQELGDQHDRPAPTPVMHRPNALITRERCIRRRAAGSRSVRSSRVQCRTMPGLAQRERDEDADDVELDQPGDLGVEGDDQHDRERRPGRGCRC